MVKKLSKTNLVLLIFALCAMLFCGLFALNILYANNIPMAYAEGTFVTLKGSSVSEVYSAKDAWWEFIDYEISNLKITNNFDTSTSIGDPIDVSEAQDGSLYAYKIDNGDSTYNCVIYADVEKIYAPEDSNSLFLGQNDSESTVLKNVKSIIFENNCFDTSQTTIMSEMFENCSSLISLDLSCFDTNKVEQMSQMFQYCNNLTSLNVSSFNTSNVIKMNGMFAACRALTILNLDNFSTSKVIDMSDMFADCEKLESLDLSNFDTSNVSDMRKMFANPYGINGNGSQEDVCALFGLRYTPDTTYVQMLSALGMDTTGMDEQTAKQTLTSMIGEIDDGYSVPMALKYLNISNFVIGSNTKTQAMFVGCHNLKTLISPAECNAEIALPQTMVEQNTTDEYTSLSSASNSKTLVLAVAEDVPSTGFVDEQLLPAVAIAIVSIISVMYVLSINKKRKLLFK